MSTAIECAFAWQECSGQARSPPLCSNPLSASSSNHGIQSWTVSLHLIDAVQGDFKDFRSLPALPDVPMAVLMSVSFDPASWKASPCAPKRCEEVVVRWRIHWLRAMMEGVKNTTLTVATAVGHYMQVEDPELVLSAIQRVVTAAAGRSAAR